MKDSLIVENLSYGILGNVSFTLKRNSLNALIGKSGSGKSTLLNCIAGLYDYDGSIMLNGNVITKSSSDRKNISIFMSLFTESNGTVFKTIIEPLNNIGFDNKEVEKKVLDISKKLGIENLIYKNIKFLSYSEKKMVEIAKTLILDSDIILLDNLFDSLDLNYRSKVINYLKNIKNSIIIFTTNDSEDLMIADNIIILNDGKIVENDTKENLFLKEKIFTTNELKLPFIIDLSHKLKTYELIDHLEYSNYDMVNELWK